MKRNIVSILMKVGIIAAILSLSTAGLLYWQAQIIKTDSGAIQCEGAKHKRASDGTVVIEEGDIFCITKKAEQHRHGRDLEKRAVTLAVTGFGLGVLLVTLTLYRIALEKKHSNLKE